MNEIITGDCVHLLKNIEDNFIDAIITDIPYGIGYDDWDVLHNNTNAAYGAASKGQIEKGGLYKRRGKPLNGWSEADKDIPKEYELWCKSWAGAFFRVLKPGASCIIFSGRRFAHRCTYALEENGFTFKDMIAWEKNTATHRAQHLSSIYERRGDDENAEKWKGWKVANMRPLFEPILWFQKPYKVGGTIADNVLTYEVGAWNEDAISKYDHSAAYVVNHSNIIKTKTLESDHGLHSAQKPLLLMQLLIELVTIEGALVLDPFCGSGTTCLAAKNTNRNYIGMERDPQIANIARERIQNQPMMLF